MGYPEVEGTVCMEEEEGYVEVASTPPHTGKGNFPPTGDRGGFHVGCKWDSQD